MLQKETSTCDELIREPIEWVRVWVPHSDTSKLDIPRVLLIGDSIVMGYGKCVADNLEGDVSVAYMGTSRFPADPAYLDEIKLVLKYTTFDAIHFNNGLHGFGYSEDDYAATLKDTVKELMSITPGATWMLANSTPVREPKTLNTFRDRNERVKVRNDSMAALATELSLPLTDLYGALVDHPECYGEDGTHFNEDGQKVQGELVAAVIRKHVLKQ